MKLTPSSVGSEIETEEAAGGEIDHNRLGAIMTITSRGWV